MFCVLLLQEVLFGRFVVCSGALVSLLEVCLVSFASSIVVVVVVACEIEASRSRV